MALRRVMNIVLLAAAVCPAGAPGAAQPAPKRVAALSRELEACLAAPEKDLDLGYGALLISREEHPKLDVAALRKSLDALAERLNRKLTRAGTVAAKLDALRELLFDEEKFGLPERDDASAFLLSDVLHNKRGNCLGLSVLCLALAERTGLKLHGVPAPSRSTGPGHLLVRYDDGTHRVNFDPTAQGAAQPDQYYRDLFKLRPADIKRGYSLANASRRDVLNLLLVNLGGARVETGRPAEALPLLTRAVALKADYAPAYMNLGAARLKLGDLNAAETDYRRAVQLDAALVGARLGLAEVALRRANYAEAEKQALSAEALEPENLTAKVLLANVHLNRGQHLQACLLLQEVARAQPDDPSAHCNLATALRLAGRLAEAEGEYRAALKLEPNYAQALDGLAETLKALGRGK